jgi:hypoxanthine phosphoribosyltransferase
MDIINPLFTANQIAEKVSEIARQIDADYTTPPLIVGVLRGSFIFMADLCREIKMPCELDFIDAKSYDGTTSKGVVSIRRDVFSNYENKDILLVEDILDTGRTLSTIKELLLTKGAKSVKITALLDKPSRRELDVKADYVGFTIDDLFVVGYGLDYNENYRTLPFIGTFQEDTK